jgi:acetate kinase
MIVLILNAGSISLKATLMESDDGRPIAHGSADWAGLMTKYQYSAPDGKRHSEEVSWKGHATAVRRCIHDLPEVSRSP